MVMYQHMMICMTGALVRGKCQSNDCHCSHSQQVFIDSACPGALLVPW